MKKVLSLCFVTYLFLTCLTWAGEEPLEKITFDDAQQTDPGATVYRATVVLMDMERARLDVTLREDLTGFDDFSGKAIVVRYTGAEAITLIKIINTKDFSAPNDSLSKVILKRLISDGRIPSGTVSKD